MTAISRLKSSANSEASSRGPNRYRLDSSHRLSIHRVVLSIHAAAENPELWNAALSGLARVTDSTAAHLLLFGEDGRRVSFVGMSQYDSDHQNDGGAECRLNGRAKLANNLLMRAPMSGLQPSSGVASVAHYSAGKPNSRCAEVLLSQGRTGALLAVNRSQQQKAYDSDDHAMIQALASHFSLALRMQQRIEAPRLDLDLMGEVLDRLGRAIIVLDHSCRILHRNRKATEFLSVDGALANRSGTLVLGDIAAGDKLRKAVSGACRPGAAISFTYSSDDQWHLEVIAIPLAPTVRSTLQPREPTAAIIISNVDQASPVPRHQLMQQFGLTATEAGLAIELFHGKRVIEVANARKVSRSTVRAQLRSILAKTNTHRQFELARLISRVAARAAPACSMTEGMP